MVGVDWLTHQKVCQIQMIPDAVKFQTKDFEIKSTVHQYFLVDWIRENAKICLRTVELIQVPFANEMVHLHFLANHIPKTPSK